MHIYGNIKKNTHALALLQRFWFDLFPVAHVGFPKVVWGLKSQFPIKEQEIPRVYPSQDLSPSLKKSGPSLQYFRKLSKLRDWLEAKTTVKVTLRLSDFQTHCWESFKEQNEQSVRQEDMSLFVFFPLNLFFSEVTKKSFVLRHESKIHIHFGL